MSEPWTTERRLNLLADLIARKRDESMGRVEATPINYETLLVLAVAPDAALKESFPSNAEELKLLAKITRKSRAEHFKALCADIRYFFGPGAPDWAHDEDAPKP